MDGGAYTVAALLKLGAIGLTAVLALALIVAGTLLKPESRNRFLLWVVAAYMTAWTVWVLYNTLVLTRVLMKMIH
jgi:hypothetical protein